MKSLESTESPLYHSIVHKERIFIFMSYTNTIHA